MIPSEIISIFVFLNFALYLGITFPLDIMTYRKGESERIKSEKPKYPGGIWNNLTFLVSGCIWLLFIVVPLEEIFSVRILYFNALESKSDLLITIQVIGGLLMLSGTFIAIFGRISRWNRAFSWGVPHQLETKGVYGWVRHPLYASYIFYFIGFPFLLLNVFLFPLLLGIPGYYYLSLYEENILLHYFPLEYSKYQKSVKRFIPFIW